MSQQPTPCTKAPAMDALIQALAERAVADYLTQLHAENQALGAAASKRAGLSEVQEAA